MLTEKTTYHIHQTETDHIEVKPIIRVYRDGVLIGPPVAGVRKVIAPGRDYSKEPGKVRRACAAAHVETRVNEYSAEEAYKEAKQARSDAVAALEAAIEAYAKALENGDQAGIDAARKARAEAKAAVTAATKARATAKAARDKARADHKAFIDSE